jgi:hypothetical protein
MDLQQISAWKHSLSRAPSRRDIVRGLAGAGLGLATLQVPDIAVAKNKNGKTGKKRNDKKTRKDKNQHQDQNPPVDTPPPPQPPPPPLVFNQFGCIDVGQPCRGDSTNCCSGICQGAAPAAGEPDTSVCVGHHNASICFADSDTCTLGVPVACNLNKPKCSCYLTTGNAGFCADFTTLDDYADICRPCTRDTDCQAEFGPGAACLVFKGACSAACPTTGRTACAVPCA